MCTAALKQELNLRVDNLPDESVRLIIKFADDLLARKRAAGSKHESVNHRSAGALKGTLRLADDFDETPECFKEYV